MEQKKEPRNGPTVRWPIIYKAGKNIRWKKRQSLQQMVLGKLNSDLQKNEPRPLSYTIHKNKLKMDEKKPSKS